MMRDFPLENGIYCKGTLSDFKLYYNNIALTPSCNALSYIPKALIAVKSDKTVSIYIPEVITNGNNAMLTKVAIFKAINTYAYLKIRIKDKIYIIDSNSQIRLCECN